MATIRSSRALFALGLVALIPAALTACSGGDDAAEAPADDSASSQTEETAPEAADQSKEDACGIIMDGLTDLSADSSELMTATTEGDTDKVTEIASALNDQISGLNDQVTNAEVSEVFSSFAESYDTIITISEEAAADPASAADKMTELTDATEALTTAQTDLQEVCG